MASELFIPETRERIESTVVGLLNDTQLMNYDTVNSPRSVGDAVQGFLEKHISECLPQKLVLKINTSFARRSMADLAFEDVAGNYYVVDIKTHNLNTSFNMPNLTSVERLARFYGDIKNYFILLLVSYTIQDDQLLFKDCTFIPIENLDWSCLTLGALGWGQIQIANSNSVSINVGNTRKKWMLQLCDALDLFYPNEVSKITQRMDYFRNVREYWENQPD
jgi:hypothetical protein